MQTGKALARFHGSAGTELSFGFLQMPKVPKSNGPAQMFLYFALSYEDISKITTTDI